MSKTDKTLKKCDDLINKLTELKKNLTNVASNRKPVNTLAGWSQDPSTGSFHHSVHGVISPGKQENGTFQPVHSGGRLKSPQNLKGVYSNISEAGAAIGAHIRSLGAEDSSMNNRPSPTAAKSEEEVDKADYGKFKGGSQYNVADNVKRKMGNTGDVAGSGKNTNVKAFSTKPGQLSAKQQAARTPYKGAAGPVKQYSPEQIAAINEANKIKKNAESNPWLQHAAIPNVDVELKKIQKNNPVNRAEELMPNQLANMMAGRSMLGTPPPKQPTDEQLFGHLVPSEDMIKSAEAKWKNTFNWLEEASKPISARFFSEEEELAYWNSIKVHDRDDGKPGY